MHMFLALYLCILNVVMFFFVQRDKEAVIKKKKHASYGGVFVMAMLGGALGTLFGMYTFHHMTRNKIFHCLVGAVLLGWCLFEPYAMLIAACVLSFVMYGYDKKMAVQDGWRVRESVLLVSAAAGGAFGALAAMVLFRHKIRKAKFYVTVPLLCILWVKLMQVLI